MKCFNCGTIGNFANKCPYPKQEDSDHEEPCCHTRKTMDKKKFKKKKKKFDSKKDSEYEDSSGDEET